MALPIFWLLRLKGLKNDLCLRFLLNGSDSVCFEVVLVLVQLNY
jgi:hypothetical protein